MSREKIKDYEKKGKESSSDYKGYHSPNLGDCYDDITQTEKDMISDCGGVLDPRTETYGGNRATFPTKEKRDDFNKKLEKYKQAKKNQTKGKNNKKDDFGKAKTQAELDKQNNMKENRINNSVLSEIRKYLKEDFSSQNLRDLSNQHGGVKGAYVDNGYSQVPLSDITDDMFDPTVKKGRKIDNGGYVRNGVAFQNQRNGIEFNDGTYAPLKKSNVKGIVGQNDDKRMERSLNKVGDGTNEYRPSTRRGFLARQARERIKKGYDKNSDVDVYLGQQDSKKLKRSWNDLKGINRY